MDFKEAIQAMLEGKKVTSEGSSHVIYFEDNTFFRGDRIILNINQYNGSYRKWSIYEEPKTVTLNNYLVKGVCRYTKIEQIEETGFTDLSFEDLKKDWTAVVNLELLKILETKEVEY